MRGVALDITDWLRNLSPEDRQKVVQPLEHSIQNVQTDHQAGLPVSVTREEAECIVLLFALITNPPQIL